MYFRYFAVLLILYNVLAFYGIVDLILSGLFSHACIFSSLHFLPAIQSKYLYFFLTFVVALQSVAVIVCALLVKNVKVSFYECQ